MARRATSLGPKPSLFINIFVLLCVLEGQKNYFSPCKGLFAYFWCLSLCFFLVFCLTSLIHSLSIYVFVFFCFLSPCFLSFFLSLFLSFFFDSLIFCLLCWFALFICSFLCFSLFSLFTCCFALFVFLLSLSFGLPLLFRTSMLTWHRRVLEETKKNSKTTKKHVML